MWIQKEITLQPYKRGYYIITEQILQEIPELFNLKVGMLNVFIKHTSASLTVNENTDPTVREDFENFLITQHLKINLITNMFMKVVTTFLAILKIVF